MIAAYTLTWHYRYWSREAIVADLDTRRHAFHVAIENWQHDFNIGTVVRNANAFLAHLKQTGQLEPMIRKWIPYKECTQ